MKKLFSISALILFLALYAVAQPDIQFDINDHDFGEIAEEDGPVTYKFEFTNLGTAPLIVNNVKASCGCTTPGWTKAPVLPGKRGYIEAQYNPINRPGSFKKSLTIYSNSPSGNTLLYIKGSVTPKARSLSETLTTKIGNLKLRTRVINMGSITNNQVTEKEFDIYNDGETPITIEKTEVPDFISVKFTPESIDPNKGGKMIVSYDPAKKDELGYVSDEVKLFTNETAMAVKKLNVVATIREYFPPMSKEELAMAPKLKFEETVVEFGEVKEGEPVSAEFIFTNTGKSNLDVRNAKSNCKCTKTSVEPLSVEPGKQGKVILTFNTEGRTGIQHQQVTVFSNDPKRSMQRIALRGTVNEKNNP